VSDKTGQVAPWHEESATASHIDHFQLAFEASPAGKVIVDPSGIIKLVNAQIERMFGYSREELVAQPIEILLPERYRESHPELRRGFFAAPKARLMGAGRDLFGRRKDGTEFHVEIGLNPYETSEGRFVLAVIIDISERKRAEEELRRSEESFRLMVSGVRDHAFILLDINGRIAGWNVGAERILGYKANEVIGQRASRFYAPEEVADEHPARDLSEAAAAGRFVRECWRLRKDGTRFWADLAITTLRNPAKELIGYAYVTRDLTDRKRAEQLVYLAIEAAPNGMVMVDANGRVVLANSHVEELFGYDREELLGQPIEILLPERFRSQHTALRGAFFSALETRSMGRGRDLYGRRKDGSEVPLEIGLNPIETPEGQFVLASIIDISTRKENELVLREKEARFRQIFESGILGILFWGRDGEVYDANDTYLDIIGYARGDLLSGRLNWIAITPPEHVTAEIEAAESLLQSKRSAPRERDYIRKDGTRVSVLIASSLFSNDPLQGISFVVDLTQQRKVEEQLRHAQKMEAIGQLTGGVAHDFNNLLLVMLGSAETLVEELSESPKLANLAKMSLTAAMRGAELTNRLLAFARRQPLHPSSVNINGMVTGMEGLLRRTLQEAIDIELICDSDLWPAIIDASALESAILNLALNSRDAMPEGGHLTIQTANATIAEDSVNMRPEIPSGEFVMIAITDDGAGMIPDVAARVFEPFFSTKPAGKGSGLGLSMVYGFVKQSGGHISLHSEPGRGTTIRLYFPRADGTARWEPAAGVSVSVPAGRGETILLVEDNDLVRNFSEIQLRNLGYKVTTASDGATALEALKKGSYDLLFTDVILPGNLNGPRLAEAVKQLRPGIKVLYASGYTEDAIVHHGRLDPGVELISKPYSQPMLARRLRQILEGK